MRTFILFLFVQLGSVTLTHANQLDSSRIFTDQPTIFLAQVNLTILRYDPGPTDGVMGNKTKYAIASFQTVFNLPATGLLDEVTEDSLATAAASQMTADNSRKTSAKSQDGNRKPKSLEVSKRKKLEEQPRIEKQKLPDDKTRYRGITADKMRRMILDNTAQWDSNAGDESPWILHSSRNPLKHNSDSGLVYVWWLTDERGTRKAPFVHAYWEILTDKDGAGVICWYAIKKKRRKAFNHCYNGVMNSSNDALLLYKSGKLPITIGNKQRLGNATIIMYNFKNGADPDLAAIYDNQERRRADWNSLLDLGKVLSRAIETPSSSQGGCQSFYRRDGNGNCTYAGRPPRPR